MTDESEKASNEDYILKYK